MPAATCTRIYAINFIPNDIQPAALYANVFPFFSAAYARDVIRLALAEITSHSN